MGSNKATRTDRRIHKPPYQPSTKENSRKVTHTDHRLHNSLYQPRVPINTKRRGWVKEYLPHMESRNKRTHTRENFVHIDVPKVSAVLTGKVSSGNNASNRIVLIGRKSRTTGLVDRPVSQLVLVLH